MDSKRLLSVCFAMLLSTSIGHADNHEPEAAETPAETPPESAPSEATGNGTAEAAEQSDDATAEAPEQTPESLFQEVIDEARGRASTDYSDPGTTLPAELQGIDYQEYRAIRFRGEEALWRDEALFEIQMFHPGFLYRELVTINVLRDGELREIAFDPAYFSYDGDSAGLADMVAPDLGFAGFRVHYPVNTAEYKDEVMVLLGASYFRLVGRNQSYGLSARGLAVDTATSSGEEFPAFREYWLVHPGEEGSRLTFFALLDSPSVTGAYRFDLEPRANTVVNVDARLFARTDVGKLGVAPLTSMFLHGENSVRPIDDFRPEIHDSDGLLMHNSSGEWIWRPLVNPSQLRVSSLRDERPRGFGLFQRDRDFEQYLDTEARYHNRPSHWVQLHDGDWGAGGVELVEIPSDSETNDNIVAYWVPETPFRAGEERRYRYRLGTLDNGPPEHDLGKAIRTRTGWGAIPGEKDPPPRDVRQFVIDFEGGELSGLSDGQPVKARLSHSTGETDEVIVQRLPDGHGWRASFRLRPEGDTPSDLRLFLELRGRKLTETWNYVWYPAELP